MSIVETVRIARDNSDGLGDYTIINKRDLKKGQEIWDEEAHIAKAEVEAEKAAKKEKAAKAKAARATKKK